MNTLRRGKPSGPSVPYAAATTLSVSASNGNLNPCLRANFSWLSTLWAEIATTCASSASNCDRSSL